MANIHLKYPGPGLLVCSAYNNNNNNSSRSNNNNNNINKGCREATKKGCPAWPQGQREAELSWERFENISFFFSCLFFPSFFCFFSFAFVYIYYIFFFCFFIICMRRAFVHYLHLLFFNYTLRAAPAMRLLCCWCCCCCCCSCCCPGCCCCCAASAATRLCSCQRVSNVSRSQLSRRQCCQRQCEDTDCTATALGSAS